MRFQLAQINIGRLLAPVDSPQIASFIEQLDRVNALAEGSPGFIWRLKSDSGNATDIQYNDDPLMKVNMSVWESIEALRDYVYTSDHIHVFRQRASWFERSDQPTYCLWWVPAGHEPTVAEGKQRLEHYQARGATEFSFSFAQCFPVPRS